MRKSTEWPICLLEYHLTPIRLQGQDKSPIKLMQSRTIRGILITKQSETNQEDYERFRDRKQEQSRYQTGSELSQIPIGSNILYYSHVRSQWFPGVVVERFHDRSYKVISEKGRIVCRNRVDLKVYHKEVSIKFEDPRNLPSELPKSQDQSQKLPNKQTGDRHTENRHLASSNSPQCNSSKFNKLNNQSKEPPKSSSRSIPLVSNAHYNRNKNETPPPPSYASPLPSNQNGPRPRPPIPKISLKRSASSPGKYHIVSQRHNNVSKHSQSIGKTYEKRDSNVKLSPPLTRSGRPVRRPVRFQD